LKHTITSQKGVDIILGMVVVDRLLNSDTKIELVKCDQKQKWWSLSI